MSTPTLSIPNVGMQQPVKRLKSTAEKIRGGIGRGVGDGLWFDFDTRKWQLIHMIGMTEPAVVVFVDHGAVSHVTRCKPFGATAAPCTDVVELPVGCEIVPELGIGTEVELQ